MKNLCLYGCLLLTIACNSDVDSISTNKTNDTIISTTDTLVLKTNITNEIAGSDYRKRATKYYLVVNNDTVQLSCILAESNSNGTISIIIDDKSPETTANQRFDVLKELLPIASLDYNFDSLHTIGFGRFIEWGDYTIISTKEYFQSNNNSTKNLHQNFSTFLPTSTFGNKTNQLLKPYHLKIKSASLEKVFFTSNNVIYNYSKIETDSTKIPSKLVDCITWFLLGKQ